MLKQYRTFKVSLRRMGVREFKKQRDTAAVRNCGLSVYVPVSRRTPFYFLSGWERMHGKYDSLYLAETGRKGDVLWIQELQ